VRDLAEAQLHCLRIRLAAMRELTWAQFVALMQPPKSGDHRQLMARVMPALDAAGRAFWLERLDAVARMGLAGIGRFEHYFAIFRRFVLPLIHGHATVEGVFVPRPQPERARFFAQHWDSRRWRLATNLFFSRFLMGRLGRDPSFFAHAEGSLPAQVRQKTRHAAVEMDPCANPYMQWILLGRHGRALPLAWRQEHYDTIRSRSDRITIERDRIDAPAREKFDGFNLSDVFEYMAPAEFEAAYGRLLELATPRARLVYWNMMAPRQAPGICSSAVRRDTQAEMRLKAVDKAFFYADLVIEDVP